MMKSRGPRTDSRGTPQKEVGKEERLIVTYLTRKSEMIKWT